MVIKWWSVQDWRLLCKHMKQFNSESTDVREDPSNIRSKNIETQCFTSRMVVLKVISMDGRYRLNSEVQRISSRTEKTGNSFCDRKGTDAVLVLVRQVRWSMCFPGFFRGLGWIAVTSLSAVNYDLVTCKTSIRVTWGKSYAKLNWGSGRLVMQSMCFWGTFWDVHTTDV